MLIKYNVFISVYFVSAIFPKYSKEQRMEKCVEGKQYWSKSLLNGACIACPPNWRSCYNEPIDDQKRCVDSCREKSTALPKNPSTTTGTEISFSTTSYTIPDLHTEPPTSSILVNQKNDEDDANKHKKPRSEADKRQHLNKEVVIAVSVLSIFAFILMVVLIVWFVLYKTRRKAVGNGDEVGGNDIGRRLAQQECAVPQERHSHHQPPIQATSLSPIRIGGIADTGRTFSSSLHLQEVDV